MNTTNLTLAWQKFRNGDSLTDEELEDLIQDLKVGIIFLENRAETGGVLFKARFDWASLMTTQRARQAMAKMR